MEEDEHDLDERQTDLPFHLVQQELDVTIEKYVSFVSEVSFFISLNRILTFV